MAVLQELVWESVAITNGQMYTEMPIVFEDVHFHRATNIPKEGMYCGTVRWSFMIAVIHVVCLMCSSSYMTTITIMFILILFFLLCPSLPVALGH